MKRRYRVVQLFHHKTGHPARVATPIREFRTKLGARRFRRRVVSLQPMGLIYTSLYVVHIERGSIE